MCFVSVCPIKCPGDEDTFCLLPYSVPFPDLTDLIIRAPFLLALQNFLVPSALASSSCSSADITPLLPSGSSLNFALPVSSNGSFGDAPNGLEFPSNATLLPALCAVSVNVVSSNASSYNFGLFLPENWNQRLATAGNGGFGGGINWPDMGSFARYGFAAMATDTGHLSATPDASWALNRPESQIDWGYRAMHGSVVTAKQVINPFYASKIQYSYYAACSTGGRQGLKEVQQFSEDFDGVLAGAPAWWTTHLQSWSLQVGLHNLPNTADYHIPASLFPTIQAEVLRQCDSQDGVKDDILSSPLTCSFSPETLLCSPSSNSSSCLTTPQIDTLYHIYSDYVETNQTSVFPHLTLSSESGWSNLIGATDKNVGSPLGTSYLQNFVFNSCHPYDYTTYSYATVQLADALDPGNATADSFDLSSFNFRGGKLIHYHGYADPLIPTGSSIYYRKRVEQTMAPQGIDIDNFYRFYLIPGMGHCEGTVVNAPWYIAGGGQPTALNPPSTYSVPGYEDEKHDALMALMAWVEKGQAPEEIIATNFQNQTVAGGVQSQRPLCPYPQIAKYNGAGDVTNAESWKCGSLY